MLLFALLWTELTLMTATVGVSRRFWGATSCMLSVCIVLISWSARLVPSAGLVSRRLLSPLTWLTDLQSMYLTCVSVRLGRVSHPRQLRCRCILRRVCRKSIARAARRTS
ncbi:uncharacterized protein L969DRAFT_383261 [Mixia osmundae IAM 14324]|uniref:uncharacterized protein n=1 Tax=Mixia osmundae (strain CBS 9802 / IAM 14324 / JCM 22182 / KY 12970) TaxID=764103 RepID=UPI0004A54653|nr:uncharacterized protein L969DRAFT_383261 [Mixia osmundae IAM 14324]KEI39842.1 hypothetical protein L969DRAFT_383261 [Mixia osmundae IAM 14324]